MGIYQACSASVDARLGDFTLIECLGYGRLNGSNRLIANTHGTAFILVSDIIDLAHGDLDSEKVEWCDMTQQDCARSIITTKQGESDNSKRIK